jgi:hypothetical protein
MRRIIKTSLFVLFSAVYIHAATGLLLLSRTMPPGGSGDHAVTASDSKAKPVQTSFWQQRRHLLLRVPIVLADTYCVLVPRSEALDEFWTSHVPRHSAVDYNSFPSSLLTNKAPPLT